MKPSIISKVPCSNILLSFTLLLSASSRAPAQTLQCVETNGYKFIASPQLDGGLDVRDSLGDIALADDFFCNTTGRVTDIHLWGSWVSNVHGTITNFWLGIYDDVPAVTNFSSGQVTPSHPGTNLLWQQSFGPGQYAEVLDGSGSEAFYDPVSQAFTGTDTQAWYYCFYPANPFVQQGTANNPTNYWLAVYAQFSEPTALYGWKTAVIPYNDAAVWSPVQPATGLPVGIWQSMTNYQGAQPQPINLAFKLTTPTNPPPPPPTGCVITNGSKFTLPPNVDNGLDVKASGGSLVLADDFYCNTKGPISDIHLWGSWLRDVHGTITNFWLGIYSDVPAVTNVSSGPPQITPSHPGNLLWQQSFGLGQYAESPDAIGNESFYDPSIPGNTGGDTQAWFYCFYPTNPFVQGGTAVQPTNYWLAVYAQVEGQTGNFGWKSAVYPYHDGAVWGNYLATSGQPIGNWQTMTNVQTGQLIDLSFILTTPTNPPPPPPPVGCVESNGTKYVQWPNLDNGFDVWDDGPWALADDFTCSNPGPITDIHLWGSWLNDQVQTNALTFWLAIYTNVPAGPVNNFSQPGALLWQEQFGPGQYIESFWSFGQESFLDPGPPNGMGPDSQVWYYCFYPTNIFVQQGSAAAPATYWLMVYAQLPPGSTFPYGWKTTYQVQTDTSVHAPWLNMIPTNNPGWTPTSDSSGLPLDLAFKLTTVTNHCIVPITCPTNKTVECGSAWSFDPPIVGPDPCCTALPSITLMVVTNSTGPCNQSYTGILTVTDCTGTVLGICTQTVTVVDTNPPVITCTSNKTVAAGTPWTFDPPTAVDACCGTNVTILVLNTFTNGTGCNQLVTRVWQAVDCCQNYSGTCTQVVTVVCPTNGCCPDTNGVKWVQRPDLGSGIDYNATQPFILADDFKCTNSGPITDIHLWGSWLADQVDLGATYILAIWSDAPTNVDRPFSHPGNLLWSQVFAPGNYTICPYTNAAEPFYNPGGTAALGSSTNLYYLCFFPDPANTFTQGGSQTVPTNYWLSVSVQSSIQTAPIYFGWKSSFDHYNDTAVQTTAAFPPSSAAWNPFLDPINGGHVDLAFKITTATNKVPPPVVCVESDYEKYVQGPNVNGGFDVKNNPYVLADDFVCTNTGPVSDIHLWGSWLNDSAQTNTIVFWLGIYDDVPAGTGSTFSHPGTNLLWQQWFTPGQYAEMVWTNHASEQFLDPGQASSLGGDSVVWYYCFYPTNAFQQTGTPTNSKTYWLAAYAQLPVGTTGYGWKTTTSYQHDISVHAPWPGIAPTNNPGWTTNYYINPLGGPAVPLDLAFKMTMCGPITIHWLPPTNVVVRWFGAGYLQSATNVNGPYLDVPGSPTSPFTDYSVTPTNKFYRLRCY